jgi:hypothetical protein
MVARPLDPDELLAAADLAGEARVLSVVDGVARLRFERVVKGRPRAAGRRLLRLGLGRVVEVKLRGERRGPRGEPILGEWSDRYQAGERVFTHLSWDHEARAYRTLWWNATRRL